MPIAKYTRLAQNINRSVWVNLPKPWTEAHDVKKGDRLTVTLEKDGCVTVRPEKEVEAHES